MTAVKQQKKNNHEPCEKRKLPEGVLHDARCKQPEQSDKVICLSVMLKYIIKKGKYEQSSKSNHRLHVLQYLSKCAETPG